MASVKHSFDTQIAPHRQAVLEHPLYRSLANPDDVRVFMRYHIYAVWDFMSLLKELQRRFTDTSRIWHPRPNAKLCRMINEIVLVEEADKFSDGTVISHYDLYVKAAKQAGAWTEEFENFYDYSQISSQLDVGQLAPNPHVEQFLNGTFQTIDQGKDHEVAAYFFIGRESLIPDMFLRVVRGLAAQTDRLALLTLYLERHIQVDGEEHGPFAEQMLEELCGADPVKWREAAESAIRALETRKVLWDGALSALKAPPKHAAAADPKAAVERG